LMLSLGSLVRAWLNIWGVFLFFGVIIGGMLIPSAIYWRSRAGGHAMIAATVLVLVGGFILRMVIVFSGQGPLRSLMWTLR